MILLWFLIWEITIAVQMQKDGYQRMEKIIKIERKKNSARWILFMGGYGNVQMQKWNVYTHAFRDESPWWLGTSVRQQILICPYEIANKPR